MYSPAEDHQKNMPNAKKMTLIDVKNSQLIVPKVTKVWKFITFNFQLILI